MSESVGKISLDLEIQSDISKQVSTVANIIGKNLKTSLNSGIKGALGNVDKIAKKSVDNISNSINNSLKSSMGKIKNTMQAVFNSFKNFKLPTFNFPKPPSVSMPKTADISSTISNRGPPVDMSMLTAQIENVSRSLDNTNARIEQQKVKLAQLRESYNLCVNPTRKNKFQEQILKTEANINKLIATSDKLGFKLNDLDAKFAKASNSAKSTSNSINSIDSAAKKATNSFKLFGNSTNKTNRALGQHRSNIGIIVRSMFTWGIVFPLVLRGLTALATAIGQGLMTNQQFANSFNQIKTNMQVAFTPILQAILPALNTLMAALAKATTYIASFISAIFGKTYQQSYQATQQLIDAKVAMGAYGDSAKKAAKDVKGLAAIDEINTLGATNANIAGTNNKIPQLVAPPVDTSAVDSAMKGLVDRIKSYFSDISFTPLINSFKNLKSSVTPILNNLSKSLKWFMDKILKPLTKWTIEDALPAFFNLLSGALRVLNPILEVFMDLGAWLWDEFLQPIASWTGGAIVSVLNGLASILDRIGNWISEHKSIVEIFTIVLGSFAAAWGLVNIAFGTYYGLLNLYNAVVYAASTGTSIFAGALSAVNLPLIAIVSAVAAVIAACVLLVKNWDWVKAKAIEVWDSIKEKFNQFKEWLGNVFVTDWSQKFGFLGDIINAYLANIRNVFDSVKRIFGGIIDFIAGVFTGNWKRAWQGVQDIFGGIMNGLQAIVKAPLNGVIGLINAAISGLNKIKLPSIDIPFFGTVGGWGFNIGKIPYLAKGGIIDNPTLAMVGEAGKEAVVPLENNTQGLDLLADKLLERLGGLNTHNRESSQQPVQINLIYQGTKLAEMLIKDINKLNRAAGANLIVG
jgi:phage-related protein|nr:MAG TPA_asm: minor tail protein [Bacteriophage sp.]